MIGLIAGGALLVVLVLVHLWEARQNVTPAQCDRLDEDEEYRLRALYEVDHYNEVSSRPE